MRQTNQRHSESQSRTTVAYHYTNSD